MQPIVPGARGAVLQQPVAASASLPDRMLIRQKVFKVAETYLVTSSEGAPLAFIERPSRLLRGLLAVAAGLAVLGAVMALLMLAEQNGELPPFVFAGGFLIGTILFLATLVRLSPRRDTFAWRDEARTQPLFTIRQDGRFQGVRASFTVQDAQNQVIGRLEKNYLYDLFRRKWTVSGADGAPVFLAREDSMLKATLRRLLGPLFGLLRTNFVLLDPAGARACGTFDRKFTITDQYVLSLERDTEAVVDRRLALALGVMLDTGERR